MSGDSRISASKMAEVSFEFSSFLVINTGIIGHNYRPIIMSFSPRADPAMHMHENQINTHAIRFCRSFSH